MIQGLNTSAASFASGVVKGIKAREDESRKGRIPLVAWTFRLPEELRKRLQEAAKKHDVTMTALVVGMLEETLPMLLADPKPALETNEDLMALLDKLRVALPQLATLMGSGGNSPQGTSVP